MSWPERISRRARPVPKPASTTIDLWLQWLQNPNHTSLHLSLFVDLWILSTWGAGMHEHRLRTNGLAVVSGLDVGDVLLVPTTQTIDTTAINSFQIPETAMSCAARLSQVSNSWTSQSALFEDVLAIVVPWGGMASPHGSAQLVMSQCSKNTTVIQPESHTHQSYTKCYSNLKALLCIVPKTMQHHSRSSIQFPGHHHW